MISDRSRSPPSAMLSVRGIGVAVSVRTSTSARSDFSRSLSRTPKRCSSSMISSPRSLKRTPGCSRRCVPTTMSTLPAARPASTALAWASPRKRDSSSTRTGQSAKRSAKRLVVLLREQRRRHQHRDLLAALHGDERGAQRHLGLAEADVAAHDPVHGLRRAQVLRPPARWPRPGPRSPRTGKPAAKACSCGIVHGERVALARGAPRIDVEQFRGGVADRAAARGCAPWTTGRRRACAAARTRRPRRCSG